jgi:hypothetical protein
LDEVADAQMSMCESLEASLSLSLETFIGTELEEATRLKNEAEEMTDTAETGFAKYLHGKNSASASYTAASSVSTSFNAGDFHHDNQSTTSSINSWNKISEGVGNQLGRMGLSTDNVNSNSYNQSNDKSLSPKGRKSKNNQSSLDKQTDPMDKAIEAACLRQNLEEIRFSQASAEMKRFQLLKHVDALKVHMVFFNFSITIVIFFHKNSNSLFSF